MTGRARTGRAVALAVGVVVALAGTGPTLAGAGAAPSQEPAPDSTAGAGRSDVDARMTLVFQDPEVEPDGTFSVLLDVVDAPPGSDIAVDIYDRVSDLDDLTAPVTDPPPNILDTFLPPLPLADSPSARQTIGFSIALFGTDGARPVGVDATWAPYRLTEPGVYPLRIRLRGPDQELLSSMVTYLVRGPDQDQTVVPTRVALVPTVHRAPVIDAEDGPPATVEPDHLDGIDDLLALLDEHPEIPMSFSATPETLDRMAVDPAATTTLERLRAAVAAPGRDLLGSPYVEVDATALAADDLGDELLRQTSLGQRVLEQHLGATGSTTWRLGELDNETVALVRSVGVERVVLPDEALAPRRLLGPVTATGTSNEELPILTTGRFDLDGRTSDPELGAALLSSRLAATATIEPGAVVVVPIDAGTADLDLLAALLDRLDEPSSFLDVVTLDNAFEPDATGAAPTIAAGRPDAGDLGDYPALVRSTHDRLASYVSMVPDQPQLSARLERPLALSAARELDLDDRRALLGRVDAELQAGFDSISIPERDRVTLGARDARFPLPIESDLDGPVQVLITLESSDRLEFRDETIEATLTGERTLIQIPVQTRVTGDTPLRITVRTPDGRVLLGESRYRIRSTAVSGVGVILTVGAAAFLAVWWGRHWHRARRERSAHRLAAAAAGAAEPPVDGSDPDDLFVEGPEPDDGRP